MDTNNFENITLSDIAKGWPHYKSVQLPYGSCHDDTRNVSSGGDSDENCNGGGKRNYNCNIKTPPCSPEQLPEVKAAVKVTAKTTAKTTAKAAINAAVVWFLWQRCQTTSTTYPS